MGKRKAFRQEPVKIKSLLVKNKPLGEQVRKLDKEVSDRLLRQKKNEAEWKKTLTGKILSLIAD